MIQLTTLKPLPFFFVGKNICANRINNFITEKHPLLSNAIGKPDTKNIWYSKEHICKLLEEIELAGGDGIRVYFGMYESTHQFSGQTCLLINSTREKIIGDLTVHEDVILENEPGYLQRSTINREIPDLSAGVERDFNYGSPCPPRCDGGTIPPKPQNP
jgi:hypothetical protein